ncbi:MAG: 4-hydroxy-tetrahydrodipicolinate reductase [Elusimicrobia bacterium]|nr:4-hydroxy-tetrahydrodipicolinate reductase [Elusimicrobiota bacterium]
MAKPLNIVVCGALGKMGMKVVSLAGADKRFRVVARVDQDPQPGSPLPEGVFGASALPGALAKADVVIDFTSAEASVRVAAAAAKAKVAAVVGSTGFNTVQSAQMRTSSRAIPLLLSPNMSPGVNLMFHLAAIAASVLPGYEASISESHHSMKKDAPSGTALALAKRIQEARGSGQEVPTVSQRMGDIIGEHTLTLAGPHERLELTHRAHSRDLFAHGALEAALWIKGRKPGLYGMRDMLGL